MSGSKTKKPSGKLKDGAKMYSDEDTLGSYTGIVSDDRYETPVQDADDL